MDWMYVFAVLLGVVTGFINTLAGSGSLHILPFFIFMGLSAPEANATNRIGVFLQTLVGSATLMRQSKIPMQGAGILIWPSVVGSALGAILALGIDAKAMNLVIGIVMCIMLIPMFISPQKWMRTEDDTTNPPKTWLVILIFFILGIYGGFIQGGVGIFMLTAMVFVAKYRVVRANMLKNVIVFIFTIPALAIFIWSGDIHYGLGLTVAAGQMVGAWFAARFAVHNAAAGKITRWLSILMLAAAAIQMFFNS